MDAAALALVCVSFFTAAALYSSVGHGGASAYIALMALIGLAPEEIRPTALLLNVLVAGYGAFRHIGAGRFDWSVFWPFAVTAIPAAYFAGRIDVPEHIYKYLLGAALGAVAVRYLFWPHIDSQEETTTPQLPMALLVGAAIGALAGLTGIGGGVYLSPLLVFFGWASAARATGIAALFIVVNSIAGLAGNAPSLLAVPTYFPWLALSVAAGAALGVHVSINRMTRAHLLRALGLVIGLASLGIVT